MSEQQSQQATTVVKATTTSACPHPEAVGKRWGDRISAQRQAELQAFLDRWEHEEDHGQRRGPFDVTWRDPYILDISLGDFEDDDAVERSNPEFYKGRLTGADIYWLARQSRYRLMGGVPNLHLEGANLLRAHLEGAGLSNVHLEGANLTEAHLEGAILFKAHLQNALLPGTHVENATLSVANLEGADLRSAHLDGASLRGVWLNSKTLLGGGSFDDKTTSSGAAWAQ